jgi:predicted O-methyltransferase YrrM
MKTPELTPALFQYIHRHQMDLHPVLPDLAAETQRRNDANMQISPEQGIFMHLLAKSIGVKRILEVGCYTGYSAVCLGLALPDQGELISCDINPETADIARRYLDLAGLRRKARIELGPAHDTLDRLLKEQGPESFDLMFIDADKENYLGYYEKGLRLLRPRGVILVDNVLWGGQVLHAQDLSPETVAIRSFNEFVRQDARVEAGLLPIADGLYVIHKKGG